MFLSICRRFNEKISHSLVLHAQSADSASWMIWAFPNTISLLQITPEFARCVIALLRFKANFLIIFAVVYSKSIFFLLFGSHFTNANWIFCANIFDGFFNYTVAVDNEMEITHERETGTVRIIYEGQCQDAVCGLASLFLFEQLSAV